MRSLLMYMRSYAYRAQGRDVMKDWLLPYREREHLISTDTITWIGHASFLISLCGVTILTDPIFGDLTFFLPRFCEPGIVCEQLPAIDAVLLSHNHRDHMDTRTLEMLFERTQCHFYVPHGDKAWFEQRGMGHRTTEYFWWQGVAIKSVALTFLPSVHWSQRGLFDRNKSLWGSWMIESPEKKIYFAGDTAYGNHFKEIFEQFGPIDYALLPIAPCEPREWMRKTHMNTQDAGQAFIDLHAQTFIPMHWGTYGFGVGDLLMPVERLRTWWREHPELHNTKTLAVFAFGQSYTI